MTLLVKADNLNLSSEALRKYDYKKWHSIFFKRIAYESMQNFMSTVGYIPLHLL